MAVPAGAVVVEEAEPQQVDHQPRHPHGDDHQRLLDLVGLGEALDGLQQDGEAEGGEEDGVDQGAHHLGAHPAEGVLLGGAGALGEAHGHQRHHQRHDVGQHVERVGQHGQRGRQAAHRHLQHEEEEGEPQFLTAGEHDKAVTLPHGRSINRPNRPVVQDRLTLASAVPASPHLSTMSFWSLCTVSSSLTLHCCALYVTGTGWAPQALLYCPMTLSCICCEIVRVSKSRSALFLVQLGKPYGML
uniref:Uncharacterized protein n=1 Tax=Anas platyrhynchos TaxID=8839 RepID=A0A8B9TVI8_ANAPL